MAPNIAIAHEHYPERGGGEHVAEHLARTFDAPIYTGFVDCETADDVEVHDLFGHGLTGFLIKRSMLARDAYYQLAWQQVEPLHDYDVIVQSGNNPGWYVPREHQTVVKYVHSTPRNPYDLFHRIDTLKGRVYTYAARLLYRPNLSYPDIIVCNSEIVARRVELYWGIDRDSDRVRVVYPPVETDSYGPEHATDDDEFYFAFSRLYPTKQMGEVVRAFTETGHRLLVGGDGPERGRLEKLAGPNVEFLGYVSEAEKRRLCAGAKAGVFAAENEDFGMVPIEFFASGTPVIGVREGYTQFQIHDGRNGLLYDRGVENLADAIRRFEADGVAWPAEQLAADAERYSVDRFRERMREAVADARESAAVEVPRPSLVEEVPPA